MSRDPFSVGFCLSNLEDSNDQPFSQCSHGGFDLLDSACVSQVEQSVNYGGGKVELSRQVGFAHAGGGPIWTQGRWTTTPM